MVQETQQVIIIGAGIAGLSTALLLRTFSSSEPIKFDITIHELRSGPSQNGGAINLTANALRILDRQLGLYALLKPLGISVQTIDMVSCASGKDIAALPFGNIERYGYESLRIMRRDLQQILLQECIARGIKVFWDRHLVAIEEPEGVEVVTARFEDGTSVTSNILLGCDGTFSTTRAYIEPDRTPVYTGLSAASGFAPSTPITLPMPFNKTSLFMSRRGTIMLSYIHEDMKEIYWTALIETAEAGSKAGWRAIGEAQAETKTNVLKRFGEAELAQNLRAIPEIVRKTEEVFFWPVYRLADGGSWYKGRVLLLGDAAHAMPPQGQGVGLALEDAVIITRLLTSGSKATTARSLTEAFATYTAIRKPHVHRDYVRASSGFDELKDIGWLRNVIKEWAMWFVLKWYKRMFDESFLYDVLTVNLASETVA